MSVSPSRSQLFHFKRLLIGLGNAPKDQGLTLIECLVAVFVIGLTVTLITPPLFIAAATRAQNRRAEQALQIAQGEVDRFRVMVSRSSHIVANLPQAPYATTMRTFAPPNGFVSGGLLKTTSNNCPTSVVRYDDRALAPDKALKVDVDGDCAADFFMQVFRTEGTVTQDQISRNAVASQRKPSDFVLGVRVYSILADGTRPGNSWGNLENPVQQASLQMTNGEGSQRKRPLAVIYTPFSWSDQSNTLCDYFQDSNPRALPGSCTPR
ncbi:MAG: prepilin-type N-terminal cleavage/methylation domain-containing protein [Oscillatoriophycideae cyanobacterium NC_groundwater_1537_Pr4_S-0.65um_50_18]|nr:prepilin-type N-terminal cleavage/methylation domain-containing protein [Oscillatoriophycideae cyanobacterium NC_groundwater_1537_Pr4_S-0.65um_50_18]